MTKYLLLLSGMIMFSIPLHPFLGIHDINFGNPSSEPIYHLAFASFGPLNDDVFIADANGNHARYSRIRRMITTLLFRMTANG
jgi:hypothetical protein